MEFPSRQTFSSAPAESWNDVPIRGRGDNNNLRGSNQNQNQTTCQLCPNIVSLNLEGNSTSSRDDSIKRSRMLKNLCSHMGIQSDDIPNECPRRISPLCEGCEDLMNQLWKLQEMMDKIRLDISNIVGSIEESVVEDHIIHLGMDCQLNQGILHLKERIMREYRKKLLVKKQLEHNLVALNNSASIAQDIHHEGFIRTELAGISTSESSSSPSVRAEDTEELDMMTDRAKEDAKTRTTQVPSTSTCIPNQVENLEFDDEEQDGNVSLVGKDNAEDVDYHCNLIITNVRGSGVEIASVEQKPIVNEPVDEKADGNDDGLFGRKKKHMRNVHKNEIARKETARKTKFSCGRCFKKFDDKKSLAEHKKTHVPECDICKRPFPNGSRNTNILSHMFSHNNDAERKAALAAGEAGASPAKLSRKKMGKETKSGVNKRKHDHSRRRHQFTCSVCKRRFPQRNWLASHMRSHKELKDPPQPVMDIDSKPPILQPALEPRAVEMEEFCDALGLMRPAQNQGRSENNEAPALKREDIH